MNEDVYMKLPFNCAVHSVFAFYGIKFLCNKTLTHFQTRVHNGNIDVGKCNKKGSTDTAGLTSLYS